MLTKEIENGFFFFFSSRRRHTRFSRDWSSDVCSSDLSYHVAERPAPDPGQPKAPRSLALETGESLHEQEGILLRLEPPHGQQLELTRPVAFRRPRDDVAHAHDGLGGGEEVGARAPAQSSAACGQVGGRRRRGPGRRGSRGPSAVREGAPGTP